MILYQKSAAVARENLGNPRPPGGVWAKFLGWARAPAAAGAKRAPVPSGQALSAAVRMPEAAQPPRTQICRLPTWMLYSVRVRSVSSASFSWA